MYRTLVAALRRERRASGELQDRPVVWTGDRWEAPGDCLVGTDYRDTFLDAVTVLPDALRDDWVFLGAHRRPTEAHWLRLLVRAGERYGTRQKVPPRVAGALRRAYRNLDSLPEELDPTTCCLLDDGGRLHAPSEAAAGTFFINDEPALASAALAAGVPLAFADTSGGQLTGFLTTTGVRMLSEVATLAGTGYGPEAAPDHALRPDAALARLHDPNFASAVSALATAVSGPIPTRTAASLIARLARIERITIVKGIRRQYHLAGHDITVPDEWDMGGDQLILDRVSSTYELRRSVASAVAVLADPEHGEQVLGDAVYFLLRSRSAGEMQHELARRKIAWQPDLTLDADGTIEADDDEAVSLADAIGREIIRPTLSPRPATTGPQQEPAVPPARAPRPPLPISGWSAPGPRRQQAHRSAGNRAPVPEAGTAVGHRAATRKSKTTARSADGARRLSWTSSASESSSSDLTPRACSGLPIRFPPPTTTSSLSMTTAATFGWRSRQPQAATVNSAGPQPSFSWQSAPASATSCAGCTRPTPRRRPTAPSETRSAPSTQENSGSISTASKATSGRSARLPGRQQPPEARQTPRMSPSTAPGPHRVRPMSSVERLVPVPAMSGDRLHRIQRDPRQRTAPTGAT